MKLIIQIPCFNEEECLPVTLAALPRSLRGVDTVEWLVVDDGSSDRTVEVARKCGADYVLTTMQHQGLARTFTRGIEESLRRGADVIVNTDADNQYCADDIQRLIDPVLERSAGMVIGTRPIQTTAHFSSGKKLLQKIGSALVRVVSRTDIADAASGFRAFSRDTAMRLNVFNSYTYTIETIIQAGRNETSIVCVPIRTNDSLRRSRLVKSTLSYVVQSLVIMFRVFVLYYPFQYFLCIGVLNLIAGLVIGIRFLWLFAAGHGTGHVQSLILCAVLIMVAFILFSVGILADIIAVNRQLLERIEWRIKHLESKE